MSALQNRTREPSTWAGFSTIIMALFSALAAWKTGDVATLSASAGAIVAGVAAVVMPEKGKTPAPVDTPAASAAAGEFEAR